MELDTPVSDAVQDYAKAIYSLGQRSGGAVSTSALADRLDVSAASASAMLKRLAAMGLVVHAPYRGTELTDAGVRVALEVIRHHRLLEAYLARPWACRGTGCTRRPRCWSTPYRRSSRS